MTFLVAIEGTITHTTVKTPDGAPANVPHWPEDGDPFKGFFLYTPNPTPIPTLFPKIYVDFGSFTITRQGGAGNVALVNGGAGIEYSDPFSTGFNNISLPVAPWELQSFAMRLASPAGSGVANPAALAFNLFTERTIAASGDNGAHPNIVTWSLLARIDVMIELPA